MVICMAKLVQAIQMPVDQATSITLQTMRIQIAPDQIAPAPNRPSVHRIIACFVSQNISLHQIAPVFL